MNAEWLTILRLRCRALFFRRRMERDLHEELQFHQALRADRLEASGIASADSARQVRLQFGNNAYYKEICRDMWTFRWIETTTQDLRYAARTLLRSPGFALIAILTLALGIGANTAIFTVVNAAILRPLPYRDPDRLVELWGNVRRTRIERRGTSLPDYADWRDQSRSFESMALFDDSSFTLTGVDEPERLAGEYVAWPYFDMLGIHPILGRVFLPAEDSVPMRDFVVVISEGLWQRRYGKDPSILGRMIQLNGKNLTVIGVLPGWFGGISDAAELWVPLHLIGTAEDFTHRGTRGPAVLGRLKPGVSIAAAQSEMDGICKRLEAAYPGTNQARGVELSPLNRELAGDLRTPLLLLLTAVGFVLLIACTNVANLLLARSEARQREIALRMALGAGRGRVVRQLITESLLLAGAGAAAGIALALWGAPALVSASPVNFPTFVHAGMDSRVALFTIVVTALAGLFMGIAPAIHVRAARLYEVASSRAAAVRGGNRFRGFLVVAEVALAMLLLAGAGLLIRTMQHLAAVRPGYDSEGVLTLRVSVPRVDASSGNVPTGARTVTSARDLLEHVRQLPSVDSAAISSDVPLTGSNAMFYTAEGQPPVNASNMPRTYTHAVGPDFFRTLRIPFVAGRPFTEAETQESKVVIVSQALVNRFWPGQDPIGKRLHAGTVNDKDPWLSIVGVVGDMKYRGIPQNGTTDPDVFFPFSERSRNFYLMARTRLDPAAIAPAVRQALRAADRTAVVFDLTPMRHYVDRATARSRFTGTLMSVFAASALLLAMIGIYGVMSYTVSRRTREIGIRIALGAARTEVLGMMLRSGMRLIAVGLVLGLAAALALTRLIASLLYGVKADDAAALGLAALLLAGVGLVACVAPAVRAGRIAPSQALRSE